MHFPLPSLLCLSVCAACATAPKGTPPGPAPAPAPEATSIEAPPPTRALVGTWSGQVLLPNQPLGITLHLGEDGAGSLDVPAQGARGLPVKVVRTEGDEFELLSEVPGAPAVLTGTRDGGVLRGTFAQRGHSFPFEVKEDAPPAPAPVGVREAERLGGRWHGAIVVGQREIPIKVEFSEAEGSTLGGTLAVPSQGLRTAPIEAAAFDGRRLVFRVPLPGEQTGAFDGTLEGDRVTGTYQQGGGLSAFWLARGAGPAPRARSSDVFEAEEVTFTSAGGRVTLAGTLTLPRGVAKPPVAVMVTGSGPQDRDEEVFGFKIFEALADQLAAKGIATLRYDDRGIGQSTGDFHAATTHDFADDAEAAVRFLRARKDVDTRRIGILGHSEGAVVGPIVAARNRDVAFLVLLAPPAQPLGDLLVEQIGLVGRSEGKPADQVKRHQEVVRKALDLLAGDKDLAGMEAELVATCAPVCSAGDPLVEQARKQLESPWFRAFAKLDPAAYLTKVRVPVLALAGSLDVQVPAGSNVALMRRLLTRAKGPRSTVEEIAGMNHLLQAAKTGAVSEYATLSRELEPQVVPRIARWLEDGR